ncbi:MAG: hypothetical protein K2M34_03705 [Alphaproteobacteria bacterium]|nr:hypothetical protein [Alphaproteobacteria bacterium]
MTKKFATFANNADSAKPVEFTQQQKDAFAECMKEAARRAKRYHAQAMNSAKETFIGR